MKAYPKYKESGIEWLGEIPDGWNVTNLKRIATKVTDGSHFSPTTQHEGLPYVTVTNVNDKDIDLVGCKKITIEHFQELEKNGCRPQKGDVLLTKDGTIGKSVVVQEDNNFVILSSIGLISPNKNEISSDYLRYYLISGINIDQMFSFIRGSALTRLTIKLINELRVVIPPIEKQQTIATYLDRKTQQIDRLIEIKQKQVELFKEQRTAIINQAVTKGVVRIMFDSNAFDKLLENDLEITAFPSWYHFYSTQTQHDEIKQIKDKEKRDKLLDLFSAFKQIDNESLTPDDTTIDDPNTDLFQKLRGNNDRYDNDAMTGITVIRENMILVSEDERLRKKVKQNGGKAISFDEFKDGSFYKMKDSGIEWLGEIPEGWEEIKIKHVADLKSGSNITSELIEPVGAYAVYGGNGVRGYYHSYTHEGNYVLIGRQGALCGNINYAFKEFWASEHAIVVTFKSNYELKWFGELLKTMNLNQYSVSAAQPGLSVDNIKNLNIPFPSISEQQTIATYLDRKTRQIDNIIKSTQTQIAQLKEYRTALISSVVTGKVDVRDEV